MYYEKQWTGFETLLVEVSNNPDGPYCHASCEQMSQWICSSFNEIKLSDHMIASNSWRHHQFTYFTNEPARAAVALFLHLSKYKLLLFLQNAKTPVGMTRTTLLPLNQVHRS